MRTNIAIIIIFMSALCSMAQTAKKNDIPGGSQIVTNEVDPVSLPIAQGALQRATEAKAQGNTNNILLEGKLDIPRVKAGTGIRVDNDGRAITIHATGVTEPIPSFSATNVTAVYDATNVTSWVEFRGNDIWRYSVIIQKVLTFSSDFIDPQSGQTLYPQSFVWPFTSNGYLYLTGDGTTPSWIFSQFNGYASIYSPSQTSQWDGLISSGTLSPSGGGIGHAYLSTQTITNLSIYRLGSFVLRDIATNVTWEIVSSNGFFEVKPQ